MKRTEEKAFAKLNLTLDVLSLREDGYHEMDMVMQSVGLCDTLTLTLREEPGVVLHSTQADLPVDGRNLAVAAAQRLLATIGQQIQGVEITLEKRIPVCAGTAGGSSDAAAVLRALNRLLGAPLSRGQLLAVAEQIGSDVPYCVVGGTMQARGRGERLTPLPALPPCHIVLCKPAFAISTPALFQRIDNSPVLARPNTEGMLRALQEGDLREIAKCLSNVFEEVLPSQQRAAVASIRATLCEAGALGSCMSGTGPTVFALFDREDLAQKAVQCLAPQYRELFLTKPV